jgi:hypothetical protein
MNEYDCEEIYEDGYSECLEDIIRLIDEGKNGYLKIEQDGYIKEYYLEKINKAIMKKRTVK